VKLFKLSVFILSFVLLLHGISPASAVTNEISYAAEDFVSARLQAAITKHRILVISELSDTSTTWVNPDGTLTTESFGFPVRVRDGSGKFGWRDLDFTLEFTDSGVEARSGFMPLVLSSGGSSDLVSFGGEFGFRWDGVLPRPVLFEDTARYVEVLPGVDLLVRLDGAGFEQFFEVKSQPSLETLGKLSLLLANSSVTVAGDGSGGYSFQVRGEEVIVSGLLALTMNRIGRSLEPWLKNTFGWFAGMFGVAIKWGIKKIIEPIIQLVVSMYFPKSKPKSKVAGRISVHAGGGR
jgi:hypothetical protein